MFATKVDLVCITSHIYLVMKLSLTWVWISIRVPMEASIQMNFVGYPEIKGNDLD